MYAWIFRMIILSFQYLNKASSRISYEILCAIVSVSACVSFRQNLIITHIYVTYITNYAYSDLILERRRNFHPVTILVTYREAEDTIFT